jgi:DNA gyrase subunit A
MFFTDRGTVYTLKVYNIPEGTRTLKVETLLTLFLLKLVKKLVEIITVPKDF